VVWFGSGDLGSFERRKCKAPLTAQSHRRPLPGGLDLVPVSRTGLCRHRLQQRRGELLHLGRNSTNTPGLGPDVPTSTGNENDVLLAPVDGKWIVLRPVSDGLYTRGMDARIDDANAGWKGRGVSGD
jgi:hypothetical protein